MTMMTRGYVFDDVIIYLMTSSFVLKIVIEASNINAMMMMMEWYDGGMEDVPKGYLLRYYYTGNINGKGNGNGRSSGETHKTTHATRRRKVYGQRKEKQKKKKHTLYSHTRIHTHTYTN
tara:strand:+ start:98 stop:454 length:357 start_codon:yes stop_codon:yes gene_type:complete